MLIFQICQYFCWKKCEKLLHCKKFSVFGYKVVIHLTSWSLNELVKRCFEQPGPSISLFKTWSLKHSESASWHCLMALSKAEKCSNFCPTGILLAKKSNDRENYLSWKDIDVCIPVLVMTFPECQYPAVRNHCRTHPAPCVRPRCVCSV